MMPRRTVIGDGKKVPLNMRTTRELRDKLNKAAGQSGRSLVQEVEYRVDHSFAEEELKQRAFLGQGSNVTLASQVHDCCVLIGAYTGKNWIDDVYSRDALLVAFRELVSPMSDEDYKKELERKMTIIALEERLSKATKTEATKTEEVGIFAVTLGRAVAQVVRRERAMGEIFRLPEPVR
jgi:hypothetical protein